MDLESIMLKKMSDKKKTKTINTSYHLHVECKKQMNKQNRNRSIDTENKWVVVREDKGESNGWNRWGGLRDTNFQL